MRRVLTLQDADGAAVDVPFKSTAATAIRYKQCFGVDLYAELRKTQGADLSVELVDRLAYVMACAGEGRVPTAEGCVDWLETLDSMALVSVAPELIEIYQSGETPRSSSKNRVAPSPGR